MSAWTLLAIAALAVAPQAADIAKPTAPAPELTTPPAAPPPVEIEITEALGSNTSHIDDMFAIRLREPVLIDGKIVLPAGLIGQGQVVHAARSSGFGKAGELILAARFLDCGGARVALRGMRFDTRGRDKSGQVIALTAVMSPFVGLLSMPLAFLSGGKVVVPAGTPATAKLSAPTDMPVGGCAAPVVALPAS